MRKKNSEVRIQKSEWRAARLVTAFLISTVAFAQETTPPAKPADQAAAPAKAEEQAKPATEAPKAEEKSPVPSGEQWFTGSFELGYRWVTDVRGSFPTYRTIVNLGEGPKLTSLD